ncbi:MAG TPA: glycosyltransferase family 39 protein, partial [Acidimicrobiales bacterium]|nr:glycosyltransferase family 39 protein [Acidimicrobiales bacterium]
MAAFVIRVIVVLSQPFHLAAGSDAADYQRLAVSLATGHGWGVSHYAPAGGPTALRAPLYPLFVAGIYKVIGVHLTAARLGGAVLGAVAVALLVVTTWTLFGRTVALATGAIGTILPSLVLASTALMTEA